MPRWRPRGLDGKNTAGSVPLCPPHPGCRCGQEHHGPHGPRRHGTGGSPLPPARAGPPRVDSRGAPVPASPRRPSRTTLEGGTGGRGMPKANRDASLSAAVLAALLAAVAGGARAQTAVPPAPTVTIGATEIGGVVTGPNGPEAGVWVIAETTDLPTKYAKIVVTDDRGRYLMPDLPAKATYNVWVRGYGLVDSAKVRSMAGRT